MLCGSPVLFPHKGYWEYNEFWYHLLKDKENVLLIGEPPSHAPRLQKQLYPIFKDTKGRVLVFGQVRGKVCCGFNAQELETSQVRYLGKLMDIVCTDCHS